MICGTIELELLLIELRLELVQSIAQKRIFDALMQYRTLSRQGIAGKLTLRAKRLNLR